MPYVVRDESGQIVGLYLKPVKDTTEEVESTSSELVDFLTEAGHDDITKTLLANYDYSVSRVLEDLIIILIRHHVIDFKEFPETAQNKLLNRESLRRILEQAKCMEDIEAEKDKKT